MNRHDFAKRTDIVQLSPLTTLEMVDVLIEDACTAGFHSLGTPYCYHPHVVEELKQRGKYDEIQLLGGGGFPDGNWPTEVKLFSIERCLAVGCGEIDLTGNLGWIKSGMFQQFEREVREARKRTEGVTLKVIIHSPQLTGEEIEKVSRLLSDCGVDYVKTDTGRSPMPTTMEQIQRIRKNAGAHVKIKASGGVRGIDAVEKMSAAGADRFGMGHASAMEVYCALSE